MKPSKRTGLRRGPLRAVVASIVVVGFLVAVPPALAATRSSASTPLATTSSTTLATSTTTPTSTVPSSSTTTVATSTTTTTAIPKRPDMPWPQQGSAAVAIPQLSVAVSSPRQPVVPIASLTKMMTTWVVLHRRPLTFAHNGPCLTVTAHEVALYDFDVSSGQSNAEISLGETLCEGTLLRGLLVHSAGDYAQLLATLLGFSDSQFVAIMNRDARVLGLRHTHYTDYSGISPGDVSTAHDQAIMAIDLMNAEPIVRRIVALTYVTLPVAGVVTSYTPLIGQYGVIGVKSGYTPPAGGCDIMAINVPINRTVITTYAVVLGQNGVNPLAIAGQAALVLSQRLRSLFKVVLTPLGRIVQWQGWSGDLVPPTTTTTTSTTTTTTTPSSSTTSTTVPVTTTTAAG